MHISETTGEVGHLRDRIDRIIREPTGPIRKISPSISPIYFTSRLKFSKHMGDFTSKLGLIEEVMDK